MRRKLLITLTGAILMVSACGGEDHADKTRPSRPARTTESPPQRGEASTPGSGGFFETPKEEVDNAASEAPETFTTQERHIYGQAKVACAQIPEKVVRPNLTVFAETLAHGNKAARRAALDGCRAGVK